MKAQFHGTPVRILVCAALCALLLAAPIANGLAWGLETEVAPVRYEQSAPGVVYEGSFSTTTGSQYSGGSYQSTFNGNCVVRVTFEGTGIDWIGMLSHTSGIATVSVDGGAPETVDLYCGTGTYTNRRVWGVRGLAAGVHTLTITTTGTKNPSSISTLVAFDAFDVFGTLVAPTRYEQDEALIDYEGEFCTLADMACSGGSEASTAQTATVEVAFNGTGMDWVGTVAGCGGIATVSVDGDAPRAVDLYSTGTAHGRRIWSVNGLADGRHKVTITVTGTCNPAASGSRVTFDAFDITGTIAHPGEGVGLGNEKPGNGKAKAIGQGK